MSDKLTHVVRPRPAWSTGEPVTICGNRAFDGDKTREEMDAHIKTECRGSVHVAYGTCCVTCLQNSRDDWRHRNLGPGVGVLRDYLERSGPSKRLPKDRPERIAAEVEAIADLIARHRDEFRCLANRRVPTEHYYDADAMGDDKASEGARQALDRIMKKDAT